MTDFEASDTVLLKKCKALYADGSKPIDYGPIAEAVAKVYPDRVAQGADGQVEGQVNRDGALARNRSETRSTPKARSG